MPKAILELDMPESCSKCKFCREVDLDYGIYDVCFILHEPLRKVDVFSHKSKNCPLKPVEGNALEKQIPQKVIETPDKHKYGYCPVCGRIYWDRCHVGNYCDQCGQRLEVEE